MTLGLLIKAEQALKALYEKRFSDGALGYRVLKELKRFEEEAKKWYEFRNKLIQETGKEEIKPEDPEWPGIVKKLDESLQVEVEGAKVTIPLQELQGMSPKELDLLDKLGFIGEVQNAVKEGPVPESNP